jgi:hypothetical protein
MGRRLQVAVDCHDPERLAAFWIEALAYRLLDPPSGHGSWAEFSLAEAQDRDEAWAIIGDPEGRGPTVLFHRVPEPKTTKNRVHLDVFVSTQPVSARDEVEAEVGRLIGLGATRVRTRDDDGDFYVVMHDPEGNEFCIA